MQEEDTKCITKNELDSSVKKALMIIIDGDGDNEGLKPLLETLLKRVEGLVANRLHRKPDEQQNRAAHLPHVQLVAEIHHAQGEACHGTAKPYAGMKIQAVWL